VGISVEMQSESATYILSHRENDKRTCPFRSRDAVAISGVLQTAGQKTTVWSDAESGSIVQS
jgi:hypothetical protein